MESSPSNQGSGSTAPTPNSQFVGPSRSFTRLDSQHHLAPDPRSQSTSLSNATTIGQNSTGQAKKSQVHGPQDSNTSTKEGEELQHGLQHAAEDPPLLSELPAEIIGMANGFIESLSAKVHPAPVPVGPLSSMFQEFYDTVAVAIFDYVSKLYVSYDVESSDQPLVPLAEIAQRKRDRKRRDAHGAILQEAVEKRVTEAVFERLWRHYSAEDEARDDSLRSKTMALTLVGVGLKELGLKDNLDTTDMQLVCEAIKSLNTVKCPYDKLSLLKKAHKAIVDVLTTSVSSTASSADHILPILIYSLIISPPDIHVISNLLYIQRFRYHKAIDGEDAYCLTNLEAAVSFLETVDMGALTTNETYLDTQGTLDSTTVGSAFHSTQPNKDDFKSPEGSISAPILSSQFSDVHATAQRPTDFQKDDMGVLANTTSARRISYLTPVEFAASAATSAVNTADQSLKSIGNSLENSYKFLFGKLSDKRTEPPKTLEDVRRLVGTPMQEREAPRDFSGGARLPLMKGSGEDLVRPTDVVVASIGGTGGQRKGDALDSVTRSHPGGENSGQGSADPHQFSSGPAYTPVADSVRNLGNQLGRFAGNINVIRSFSRSQMSKTPPPTDLDSSINPKLQHSWGTEKLRPPVQRFLDGDTSELKIGDVALLLQDYRRLAMALKDAGAF